MKFVSCDPGETTGYAVWPDALLGQPPDAGGQAALWDFIDGFAAALGLFDALIQTPIARGRPSDLDLELVDQLRGVEALVCEDWALYPWKAQELAWDKCRTARGIGALELICRLTDFPIILQAAAIKDSAVGGGAEEFFVTPLHPNRHQNDAIMHGVFYKASQVAVTA